MTWYKKHKGLLFAHIFLIVGLLQALFPFLWMIVVSLMTYEESISTSFILPQILQWKNYIKVFETLNVPILFLNSVLMTAGVVFFQLLFCSMAGYAFAKIQFPYKKTIFMILISILMVPGNVFLLPQYLIMVKLKLLNTITGLILPGAFSIFGTFFMRQNFLQVDSQLGEAALVEGANHFQIYWKIMLPLVRPYLITLAIIDGIWAWNNLIWPLILNSDPNKMTLSSQLAF